jgi:hypothetical protein
MTYILVSVWIVLHQPTQFVLPDTELMSTSVLRLRGTTGGRE